MIQSIDLQDDRVVGLRVEGTLTAEQLRPIMADIDRRVAQYGSVHAYVEYAGVDTMTLKVIWEDLKFDLKHLSDYKKVAIVSDQPLMNLSAGLANLVPGMEVKLFSSADREQAKQWATSGLTVR